ncbi:cache domain-containing protein [Holophaga foetida]|uniref:cache domain-containing protein n=1 Tax=Holophaga foetida TaxID=35839 RepID=UPI0002475380|nr:cache domain-containing protein [Holophaga foetida]
MTARLFTRIALGTALFSILSAQGPADAEALVKEAVTFAKTHGAYKLIKEANTPGGAFHKGNLYIWVVDMEGVMLANGANPKLVGKDASEKSGGDSVRYAEEAVKIAEGPGKGWFAYKFKNPVTDEVQQKECYVEKLDEIIIACGAYKQ